MRIGIANDLGLAVEAIRRALARQPDHVVLWVARDGVEAVERCAAETPDLVLMDLFMPRMTGVEATRRIMAASPCAILIVTSAMGATMPQVFEAIGAGALDVVDTPIMTGAGSTQSAGILLAKIESLRKLVTPSGQTVAAERPVAAARPAPVNEAQPSRVRARWLVAIGCSAGGPAALATILSALPADFPAAIVIVQHLDPAFAAGLVAWLATQLALPISLAAEGEVPLAGHIYLADGHEHLVVDAKGRLHYTGASNAIYVPSIDVFFDSVVAAWDRPCTAILLTGMGRDGAAGLRRLRDKGVHTLAQDRASSAVYGMPKAAADLHAAVEVLPLDRIAPALKRLALNPL